MLAVCLLGVLVLFPQAQAQTVSPDAEYNQRLKARQTIAPGGETPFGERLNLYTGEVSFQQPDVTFEGTGPTIRLVRVTTTSQEDRSTAPFPFGSWDLSIPRIDTFLKNLEATAGDNWQVGQQPSSTARCTQFGAPRQATYLWWHGYALVDTDGNRQPVLQRAAGYAAQPAVTVPDGGGAMVFPAITQDKWQLGCLPATSNGQVGEAFLAVAPDGTRYWLDYLVQHPAKEVVIDIAPPVVRKIQRVYASLYVSRIEDRFGNWLQYHYCNDVPTGCDGRLTSITASDGRSVVLTWRSDVPVIGAITQQAANGPTLTWSYEYALGTSPVLTAVVLPDGSRWAFSGDAPPFEPQAFSQLCDSARAVDTSGSPVDTKTLHMTTPSGLAGTFVQGLTDHPRSYVLSACNVPTQPGEQSFESVSTRFLAYSLLSRTQQGPGLAPATWSYHYPSAQSSASHDPCAATQTCQATTYVEVTDPDGNRTRHTFSTRWGTTEGQLLSVEQYQGAGILLSSTTYDYAASDLGPWPAQVGISLNDQFFTNTAKLEAWMPLRKTTTVRQGRTFLWEVPSTCGGTGQEACFDAFGRPTRVIRSSAP